MGQQTYYNPKNGKGNLGGETLEKLCGLVNCQPGALMELEALIFRYKLFADFLYLRE